MNTLQKIVRIINLPALLGAEEGPPIASPNGRKAEEGRSVLIGEHAAIEASVGTQALSMNRSNAEMLREYYRSIYLWRCVDMIAQMASSVELEVAPESNRDLSSQEEQIEELLERPNPQWTHAALQYFVAASLAVANRAYLLRVRGTGGATLELWPINANEVINQYAAGTKVITSFQWMNPLNPQNRIDYPVDDDGDSDIIFIHRPSLNPMTDRSPASVAAPPAEVFSKILQRCYDIVSGAPNITGVLSTETELNENAIQKIKDRINQYRTGGAESGGTIVAANAKWTMARLSEDPTTALDVQVKDSLARDVCMTFGVPSQLVGLPGTDTYNNLALARVGFMTDTVLPGYINLYVAALNLTLMRDLDAKIEADIDGLPAMRTSRLMLVETASKATMLSINEQRELLGYPPYEDEDLRALADKPILLEELERKRLQVELQFGPLPDNPAPR